MLNRGVMILLISAMFITACTTTPTVSPEKKLIVSLKQQCEEQDKVWIFNKATGESSCVTPFKDFGKRCRNSYECQGFCEGSNASTSSGKCSAAKPVGCVYLIEQAERFRTCYND